MQDLPEVTKVEALVTLDNFAPSPIRELNIYLDASRSFALADIQLQFYQQKYNPAFTVNIMLWSMVKILKLNQQFIFNFVDTR